MQLKARKNYHIEGYFPKVQIFPNGEPLALAEIFPIQKFPEPDTLIRSRDRHSTKFYGLIVVRAVPSRSPCDSLYYYHSIAMCYRVATL